MSAIAPNFLKAQQAAAAIADLLLQSGVNELCLFGSRIKGTDHADSDWDFRISFSRPVRPSEYFSIKQSLQDQLGQAVHLCSPQYTIGDAATHRKFLCAIAGDCRKIWSA